MRHQHHRPCGGVPPLAWQPPGPRRGSLATSQGSACTVSQGGAVCDLGAEQICDPAWGPQDICSLGCVHPGRRGHLPLGCTLPSESGSLPLGADSVQTRAGQSEGRSPRSPERVWLQVRAKSQLGV